MDLNPHCKPYKVVPPGEKLFIFSYTPSKYTITIINPIVIWFFSFSLNKIEPPPCNKVSTAASRDVRWPAAPPTDGTEDSRSTPKDLVSPQIAISRGLMVMVMDGDDFHGCPMDNWGDPKWLIGTPLYDWCLFIFFVYLGLQEESSECFFVLCHEI